MYSKSMKKDKKKPAKKNKNMAKATPKKKGGRKK
tara:strand:- start:480 stop:581 length:102 start_codon:yes stop_codon:yes gene_type:complete